MIFYFTGTGNSLYVAKQLEQHPISIAQAIHEKELSFEDETIGIVAPIYGHEMPGIVKDFIKRSSLKTDYLYLVLTYGNRHGGAAELACDFCKEYGILPSYINIILMVDNWLPGFDMDQQQLIDKKVDENISLIYEAIKNRENMIPDVTVADRAAHEQFLERMKKLPEDAWQHLYHVTGACIGCGLCKNVCPADCITVVEGKAIHSPGKCQTCMACIHACPTKAIQLNIPEKNPNARYRNEHIKLNEIIEANNQHSSLETILNRTKAFGDGLPT